ncbi:MAG: CDP-glycerol glycerophosphotransferase family protein, partial [Nocardioidaceae bacterium]
VDSDDRLPQGALSAMVRSARESGSDIVVGSVRRFKPGSTWKPTWVDDLHGHGRAGVTIDEFPALVRNNYTWCKLYRRAFWESHGLWFREGVSYEDQPIVTQLYIAAAGIDVLPDVVYHYRVREDSSSISQQTASVSDLLDRISAWRESHQAFAGVASPTVYDAWLQTLFDAHFHWYLRSPGTADDEYWAALQAAVVELTGHASDATWAAARPQHRVPIELARQDRRSDVQEFFRRDGQRLAKFPATVTADGVDIELPYRDDPQMDAELFLLRPAQLDLSHAVQRFHWIDGSTMRIAGWAYIRHLDLTDCDSRVTLLLRNERTGDEHAVEPVGDADPGYRPPDEDEWVDYHGGEFEFSVPMGEIVGDTGQNGDVWTVRLRVDAAGFTVEDAVTRVKRSSSAGVMRAGELPGGDILAVNWHLHAPFTLQVHKLRVEAVGVRLDGRTLSGSVAGPESGGVRQVLAIAPGDGVAARAGTHGGRFELVVPEPQTLAEAAPGTARRTRLVAELGSGERVPLARHGAREIEGVQTSANGALGIECTRIGEVGLIDWRLAAYAESVDVTADGLARVSGRVYGPGVGSVSVRLKSKKTLISSPVVEVEDGHFVAEVAMAHTAYRFGEVPLPAANHDLSCEVHVDSDDEPVVVPLLVSRTLNDALPVAVQTDRLEGRFLRGTRNMVRLALTRPLGAAAGKCRQNRLRKASSERFAPTELNGLLIRSYFGESATDGGRGLERELRRRGADIDIYWSVQDHSVPVPDGVIPVIQNSLDWYRVLNSAQYYMDNMYQPDYHVKPDGQVIVQTFHGYPFKTMGHPHWEQAQFSQQRIDSYDRRARDWDYVVSPASYATPLLARDFAYDGEMLEIGYPRNDILFDATAPDIRAETRRTLGIADHQTAVLYAPTFRDYLSPDDNRAAMVDFFDLEGAMTALGEDFVLLVRGHAFNARTQQRVGVRDGIIDVTDYPLVSDLYLAADAAVVDYSSLRFDFGVTGKPMVFHVPDLDHYNETRGWLFDFEPTAPGPLVSTTAQVVECVRDLDGVQKQHADAYDEFRRSYLDLEDGSASARLVDAVFVPRGDAPPR